MQTEPQDGRLTFHQCWDLLAASVVGRLAIVVDGHPEIFPVNGYDAGSQEAWSVMVRGTTDLVDSEVEQAAADALGLEPWEPGDKSHYVRLSPQVLTGRRFKVAAPHLWSTRLEDQRRAAFE